MNPEMEDIHNNVSPSLHKGLKYYDMGNEGLEGELIEGRPQIPNFKAFKLDTSEAKDKEGRLAKIELWEENMKRNKARKQLNGSVEGAACTRKVQAELPLISSTPSPSPQDSIMYNTRQESVSSEMSGWTEEEREQAIHNGMYGDAYGDIYGDVYWDANVDLHEENPVSESLSRTRRKKSNRSKQRKKAAELQASLQAYGLLPVPLPPQPLQEQSDRTGVREQEVGRQMAMERSNSGGLTLQHDRLKQIADLRERIRARKALVQAQGLLPVSPSRQNVQEGSIRTFPDSNTITNVSESHDNQVNERQLKPLEMVDIENLRVGANPQKKGSSQHNTKSPKTYQVRLQEQRNKMRAKTQKSALDRQKSYGIAATPAQPTQNDSMIVCRSHENDAVTTLQQDKDTKVKNEVEPSTSITDEIRVLIQRVKDRRKSLSALNNFELTGKMKEEQEQGLSAPEHIGLSIESTIPMSVPAKMCDVAEKMNSDIVPRKAAFSEESSSLHAHSAPQTPWQENSSIFSNARREVSQLECEQGHHTKGAEDGEPLPILMDNGFLPENVNMEIDLVIEHRDEEDVAKLFSIPQNIGDMLDNARRRGTKIGEAISIPEMLSHLLFMPEVLEEMIKMEKEWLGWLGVDTDVDADVEDFINSTTPSSNTTIEHRPDSEETRPRATPDISAELFSISEDIEDMISTENKWFGWLGMDVDVEDFAGYHELQ
ncbi:uncharacterized protein EAF01_008250 [Botrytis porri]|uniref:Uncharacterized protein n=1 Tax=Botrytis porri TaxID=87229 RepID=A0A4Z1L734_9HELO|nr:uncharacterized protein EAF01_008250 [Botrytis porri]KAF7899037.1 hypothetical protein EAF01_008250 [Botrytis porri]TGO92557.1 hypothetical protein BPOR_0001g00420 [Botrytis porri]